MKKALAAVLSDQDRRDLVESHLEFVKMLAYQMVGTFRQNVDIEDLIQNGVLGLIAAAGRFDPALGNGFTTFAQDRVRGAMVDALRKESWPRSIRQTRREIEQARVMLRNQLNAEPDLEQIAMVLGIDQVKLEKRILKINTVELTVSSAQEEDIRTDPSFIAMLLPAQIVAPDEEFERIENRERVLAALDKLPDRDRRVILLYYFEELTMGQIGEILGVTQSMVSKIRARAIKTLCWLYSDNQALEARNSSFIQLTVLN